MYEAVRNAMTAAGNTLLGKTDYAIHSKEGLHNFVTDMDVEMQELLRVSLAKILPEAAFVSEEDLSATPGPGQLYWLVDPIDGTTNFIHNLGLSCLVAALCRDSDVLAAAVYNPWTNEFFWAEKGRGATLNGKPIHVSGRDFGDAMVALGQGYGNRSVTLHRMRPLWETCYTGCRSLRGIGSAELSLCYVAAGRLDAYLEHAIMPWDYAAGNLIVREAGGIATNWQGEAPSMTEHDSLLAANPAVYRELSALCKSID